MVKWLIRLRAVAVFLHPTIRHERDRHIACSMDHLKGERTGSLGYRLTGEELKNTTLPTARLERRTASR